NLRHLHQGDRSLLHPCTTGRRTDDHCRMPLNCVFYRASYLFTHDRHEGPAYECQFHGPHHRGVTAYLAAHGDHCIEEVGAALSFLETSCIGLGVHKLEGIGRYQAGVKLLLPLSVVENYRQPLQSRDAEVVAAFRANLHVLLNLALHEHLLALRAFHEKAFGADSTLFVRSCRAPFVFSLKPAHCKLEFRVATRLLADSSGLLTEARYLFRELKSVIFSDTPAR